MLQSLSEAYVGQGKQHRISRQIIQFTFGCLLGIRELKSTLSYVTYCMYLGTLHPAKAKPTFRRGEKCDSDRISFLFRKKFFKNFKNPKV